jgi:flagellar assembly factor FliW
MPERSHMQLETTRFGTVEVDSESIITFTQPILGFQEFRRYVLLPGPSDSLAWLQSTESGELAFILVNPKSLVPEYEVELRPQELTELAVTSAEELDVYTLVVVPDDQRKVRTNLRAPILINPKHRLGKQTILEFSDYPIQYYLAQAQPDPGGSTREISNARSDT